MVPSYKFGANVAKVHCQVRDKSLKLLPFMKISLPLWRKNI